MGLCLDCCCTSAQKVNLGGPKHVVSSKTDEKTTQTEADVLNDPTRVRKVNLNARLRAIRDEDKLPETEKIQENSKYASEKAKQIEQVYFFFHKFEFLCIFIFRWLYASFNSWKVNFDEKWVMTKIMKFLFCVSTTNLPQYTKC